MLPFASSITLPKGNAPSRPPVKSCRSVKIQSPPDGVSLKTEPCVLGIVRRKNSLCAKSPTQYNDRRFPIVLRLAGKGGARKAFAARNAKGARLVGASRTLPGCDSEVFLFSWNP